MSVRSAWLIACLAIIALGICTRIFPAGHLLWDKYLGDALYAAMVYVLLRLLLQANPLQLAITTFAIMTAIEVFQLTGIPASMMASHEIAIRIFARLLGTHFSFVDLFAYSIGISFICLIDLNSSISSRSSTPPDSI